MPDDHYITLIKQDRNDLRDQLDEAISLLSQAQFWGEMEEQQRDWQERLDTLWRAYHTSLKKR